MNAAVIFAPIAGASACAVLVLLAGGGWPATLPAAAVGALLAWRRGGGGAGTMSWTRTVALAADPQRLANHRRELMLELDRLEDALESSRGVFEVSAELVGCVSEADARARFIAAVRRYWYADTFDLMVWEKGEWRGLGAKLTHDPPALDHPVQLPDEADGDLVLDLSPGIAGHGCLVLHGARCQPAIAGRPAEEQRAIAEVLRGQLCLSLRRVLLYGELQALARIDPLTGTHRRWYGEARLNELVEGGMVVTVAMIDIDHFKTVNDRFGHAAGDRVLAAVGRALIHMLRTNDLVARMGGEEFLCVLPNTLPDGAEVVTERMRQAIANLKDLPQPITVSIGFASLHQDETMEHLLLCADEALYLAKENGRNRVVRSANTAGGSRLRQTLRHSRILG